MKHKLTSLTLFTFTALATVGVAIAACYPNTTSSQVSCCNPDTSPTQTKTTQDQSGQNPAYTFCIGLCQDDHVNCVFQTSAPYGCTSSGNYSNVWRWTANGIKLKCSANAQDYYTFTYDLLTPTPQGETVKYIIDNMNCLPHS